MSVKIYSCQTGLKLFSMSKGCKTILGVKWV